MLINGSDRDRDPEIWVRYRAFPGVVPLVTRLANPVGPHTLVEQVELIGLRPKGVPPAKIDGLAVRGLFAPAPIVDVIDQRERERGSDSPLGRLTDQEFRALFE